MGMSWDNALSVQTRQNCPFLLRSSSLTTFAQWTIAASLRQYDSVAKVLNLVTQARSKGAFIVYSVAVPGSVPADILSELTPAAGEPVLPPLGPDKFIASDLEKILKDKGIKTIVAMGTQAQTSVLHTAGAAALRGFKVIVPVDGMSADEVFPELYTAWHLATAARISPQVTLTKFDLIEF